MNLKKAIGARGLWHASVDGEALPCVHEYWWSKNGQGRQRHYNDRLLAKNPHNDAFVAEIVRKRRVILTSDKPHSRENPIPFTRTGYIAVWSVDEIEFDDKGLRFKFVDRLYDLN